MKSKEWEAKEKKTRLLFVLILYSLLLFFHSLLFQQSPQNNPKRLSIKEINDIQDTSNFFKKFLKTVILPCFFLFCSSRLPLYASRVFSLFWFRLGRVSLLGAKAHIFLQNYFWWRSKSFVCQGDEGPSEYIQLFWNGHSFVPSFCSFIVASRFTPHALRGFPLLGSGSAELGNKKNRACCT